MASSPSGLCEATKFHKERPFSRAVYAGGNETKRWGNNLTKQETKPDVTFYKVVEAGLPLMKLVPFTTASRALCLFSAQAG